MEPMIWATENDRKHTNPLFGIVHFEPKDGPVDRQMAHAQRQIVTALASKHRRRHAKGHRGSRDADTGCAAPKAGRGAIFAFRGCTGDRLKLLYWDGQGLCLYDKVLQKGRFPWPNAGDRAVRLTSAQLAMLWEGIDWRRPDWGAPPARVG